MKKYLIVLFLVLLFPFMSFAKNSGDVSTDLQAIGVYLNHQDFQKAQEIRKDLLKNISLDILAKDLSYSDFITLIQTLSWEKKGEEFSELFRLRDIYHPEDSQNATLLSRKNRDIYWKNCTSNKVNLLDHIDASMCVIYTDSISLATKKIILTNFISKNYSQILNGNDIQGMSDFGNLITAYISIDPRKKVLYSSYQKKIGFQIIKKDPFWINGYLFLISNSRILKEQNNWIKELTKNYKGDKERWEQVIVPYIDSYK